MWCTLFQVELLVVDGFFLVLSANESRSTFGVVHFWKANLMRMSLMEDKNGSTFAIFPTDKNSNASNICSSFCHAIASN